MSEPTLPTPIEPAASKPTGRKPLGRAIDRFLSDPASGRNAVLLIVAADLLTVVIGGLLVWLVDRKEFEHLTEAFWYILQTVTTVGYGDVTPTDTFGRLVGAVVMLLGIAFLSVLTASITSAFIEARQAPARARQSEEDRQRAERLEARLDEVLQRLARIEGSDRPEGEAT